ncbi:hypothetical protein EC991_007877 [Linnemannia zychae]|nr:hypothetical protein EC991_007877 [Linnemannia zychae]
MRRFTQPAAFLPAFMAILAALTITPVTAQTPDPVMDYCSNVGCSTVVSLLNPCGGGASNSSLQQDLTFTVTPDLGSCECNSRFFNALSECLGCISSQGKNRPVIDTQINWTNNCKSYGFNFTDAPIPYIPPTSGGSSSGGLGGGAIAGIVIGVLAIAAAVGGFFFFRNRRGGRSKNSIFKRPYTAANASGSYEPTNNQTGFNTYSNYQQDEYPDHSLQQQGGGYSDYDQNNYYGSGQNGDDSMAMSNLQHSNYIPPPIPMSPSAVAAVASTTGIQRPLGEPRPSDQFPQSLRVGANKEWDDQNRQNEYTSELISNDHLLHNDKAVIEDDDELEPPRARDRFRNDRDDFTQRRSMTPPRANMQSYRDEFTRPSFDREPRRNSGSERGSVSGLRVAAGGSGYNSQDEGSEGLQSGRLDMGESPESARRRRAAELFSAEGSRR